MSTSIGTAYRLLPGLFIWAMAGAACGDEEMGAAEPEVAVSASPLQADTLSVYFNAIGAAIGTYRFEPAIGGPGSPPSEGASAITLRLPEGRTEVWADGFHILEGSGGYWNAVRERIPAHLRAFLPFGALQLRDVCPTGSFDVQAGRRISVAANCSAVPQTWAPGAPEDQQPASSRYVLMNDYAFVAGDRFAGSDGSNIAIVFFGGLTPSQSVDVWAQGGPVGCFTAVPDPVSNPSELWPEPGSWSGSCTVTADQAGVGWLALVAVPDAPAAGVEVWVTDDIDAMSFLGRVRVRVGRHGTVTVRAE